LGAQIDGGLAFGCQLLHAALRNGRLGESRLLGRLVETLKALSLVSDVGERLPENGLAELSIEFGLDICYIFWARFDFVEAHLVHLQGHVGDLYAT
jgi:hypothetical protein